MGLKYEKPKGQRIKRYGLGIHLRTSNLWYNNNLKRWEIPKFGKYEYSNYVRCKTVRAFRRHLRKNPNIKGDAILVNRYIGYNVYG